MGIPTLISTSTASNASAVAITSGIDSTYDEYMFVFTDINPATDTGSLMFQVNATDGADYNDSPITSTTFIAYHQEDDGGTSLAYQTGLDQAQGTAHNHLLYYIGSGSDESAAGILHLFNPASTTFIKHFYARCTQHTADPRADDVFVAGYINDTTAIDNINFQMDSGNFDGVIQMYGIA